MQVLIVDDDRSSTTILSRALKLWGFDVIVAHDGDSAWEQLTQSAPPLAILDWMMPALDGVELCRRIRGNPLHAQMYVILLTGRSSRSDVVNGLEAGADDYVIKPVDLNELRARVHAGVRLLNANVERERLLNSISSILIRVDADGRVTRWNAAAQEIFGIEATTVLGRPITDCGIAWSEPAVVRGLLESPNITTRLDALAFTDSGGRRRLVGLTITTMHRGSEDYDGFVVLGAEVTARRILEQQLRQAQKLESVGQLAAGIAHEINTPMQYVGDNVRFLQDSCNSLSDLFESVLRLCRGNGREIGSSEQASLAEAIVQAAERADLAYLYEEMPKAIQQSLDGVQHVSRIVKAMKDFSHPGTDAKVAVDLNRAIETTLTVARNELKYVADTHTELDSALPLVPCLPGEINQVLLNLLVNAAHAVRDALGAREHERGLITISTTGIGDAVEIRVSDTGTGIPEEVRSRIFEPFFTTKGVGRGTGQGLALAHTVIVKKHGGQIWFETEVGKGTTFIVRLPLNVERPDPERELVS